MLSCRHHLRVVAVLLFLGALALGPAWAQHVPAAPDPTAGISSADFPLTGTIAFPPDRFCPGESVAVSGVIHVIQVVPPDPLFPEDPVHVYLTLPLLQGTGLTSRSRYTLVGAGSLESTFNPADPRVPVRGTFAVFLLSSCPLARVTISGTLHLTELGTVDLTPCPENATACTYFSITQPG